MLRQVDQKLDDSLNNAIMTCIKIKSRQGAECVLEEGTYISNQFSL